MLSQGRLQRLALRRSLLVLCLLPWTSCASTSQASAPPAHCIPSCAKTSSCASLDDKLVEARNPLLDCIGRSAARGHLAKAHRCYRALRLMESARWWLETLIGRYELTSVYQPAETIRREFLCRIEQLTKATDPQEVERIYLDMIRSYP